MTKQIHSQVTKIARRLPLLAFGLFLSLAQAEEGFGLKDTLPGKMDPVWDSSLLTSSTQIDGLGTAVLLRDYVDSAGSQLFLTVAHLIPETCEAGKMCEGMQFYFGYSFDTKTKKWRMASGAIQIPKLTLVDIDRDSDLAVLAPFERKILPSTMTGIALSARCDTATDWTESPVFFIGYPATLLRGKTKPIPAANFLTERYSSGKLGKFDINQGTFATTADGLPGNSGSAGVDIAGELIGLYSRGTGPSGLTLMADPNAEWNYFAQAQSYMIPCKSISHFLAKYLNSNCSVVPPK